MSYQGGVSIGCEVTTKHAGSLPLFEYFADATMEGIVVLAECGSGIGGEAMLDARTMVGVGTDRHDMADKLFEFVAEFAQIEELAILQLGSEAETAELIERLELVFPTREYPVYQYGPVLASHIGPGTMGIVVYEGMY